MRRTVKGRPCVRCKSTFPTPYLREVLKLLPRKGDALDIGCGNGRNSEFLKAFGFNVDSIDLVGDYGEEWLIGVEPLPDKDYDVFLANYVLMFLTNDECRKVLREINDRARVNAVLVIEMYKSKVAYTYIFDNILEVIETKGWVRLKKSKDRCVLKKEGLNV